MGRILLALMSAAYAPLCLAGWVSGGGEFTSDSTNPWWIDNTKNVQYCIKIDEENFGTDVSTVRNALNGAVAYWNFQLSLVKRKYNSDLKIWLPRVGTQSFEEVTCDKPHDLTLQFGVLTAEQTAFFSQGPALAAVSVRTDYDKKNLRAKGFVYLAPEKGDLAPKFFDLVERPWIGHDGSAALEATLIHEFGHIFGFHHEPGFGLFSHDFPQYVRRKVSRQLDDGSVDGTIGSLGFQVNFLKQIKIFKSHPLPHDWFEVTCLFSAECAGILSALSVGESQSLVLRFTDSPETVQMYRFDHGSKQLNPIGQPAAYNRLVTMYIQEKINLFMPSEQEVIPMPLDSYYPQFNLAEVVDRTVPIHLNLPDGRSVPLKVDCFNVTICDATQVFVKNGTANLLTAILSPWFPDRNEFNPFSNQMSKVRSSFRNAK